MTDPRDDETAQPPEGGAAPGAEALPAQAEPPAPAAMELEATSEEEPAPAGPEPEAAAQDEPAEEPRPPSPPPPASETPRPALAESAEPLYREAGGFRMRLEPADLARLRELPGSKGRTDRELGEEFFEKLSSRFAESLAEDVAPPAEVRVVVDPYSRQAFLAIERTIRSILSF